MKHLYDQLSREISKLTTQKYSTSFSLGVLFLDTSLRSAIYSIYGFVRLADEIVDSFHGFNKKKLLEDCKKQTYEAIENKISFNPILHAFQEVVNQYEIPLELIEAFLFSMEMDLEEREYNQETYQKYIYGSAEVVGLMCLKVFVDKNQKEYDRLLPSAKKLGSAFQKINFLRDIQSDNLDLGRTYFPEVDVKKITETDKKRIEKDIQQDFDAALKGILQLPKTSRFGVFLAYYYYISLFEKIKKISSQKIMNQRVRISNLNKYFMLFQAKIKLFVLEKNKK
jgi:15-cis-phytoene synthase